MSKFLSLLAGAALLGGVSVANAAEPLTSAQMDTVVAGYYKSAWADADTPSPSGRTPTPRPSPSRLDGDLRHLISAQSTVVRSPDGMHGTSWASFTSVATTSHGSGHSVPP